METFLQDIRYASRSLFKSRRFAISAILTLGLGIGINTAMFSVIYSVLVAPWPVKDPSRILVVYQRQQNGGDNLFSTADFLDWKQQGGLLARMGAHVAWQFNVSGAGQTPERIAGAKVSAEMLTLLGVQPALGRLFSDQQDHAGAGNAVVISYSLWKNRYGADAGLVGRAIQLDGQPYTVLGVMPAGFDFFGGNELLWTPLQLARDSGTGASPNIHWLLGMIRLSDGVSLKQARAQADSIAEQLRRRDGSADIGFGVDLLTVDEAYTGNVRGPLLMLMGCVAFVLLIACANVANLLLARGASRSREMAVRTALGASRSRIVRQLLTESVLIALSGGALGIGLAFALVRGMLTLHPPSAPRIDAVAINGEMLAFSILVSAAVGVLFGLWPALDAARIDPNAGLRERDSGSGRGFGGQRAILVVTETALASVLLIATGLALESLWSLRNVELGFAPAHVQTFRLAAPARLAGEQITDFYRRIAERIQASPGVQSVAVARNLPMSGTDPSMPITVEGNNPPLAQGELVTRYRAVGEQYFRTLQIPLLDGRPFDARDAAGAPDVAIVSQSLARKYWPGEKAIGKRLKPDYKGSAWCTVVGVVGDVRHWGLDVDIEPTAYYPYAQIPDSIRALLEANMGIAVRSNLAPGDLLRAIRADVAEIDSAAPLYDVKTMDEWVSDSGSLRRFDLSLLGGFSALALGLAAIGVYGVMAYSVSRRTREIGVRMAMGAQSQDVLRLILAQGAKFALIGVAVGDAAAILLRKLMASLLYGVSNLDPIVLSAVPLAIVTIVLLACYLPARRAASIDPMAALRCE